MRSPLAGRPPARTTSGAHRANTDSARAESPQAEQRRAASHRTGTHRAIGPQLKKAPAGETKPHSHRTHGGASSSQAIDQAQLSKAIALRSENGPAEARGSHRRQLGRARRAVIGLGLVVAFAATALAANSAFGFSIGTDHTVRASCETDGSTCSGHVPAQPAPSTESSTRHSRRSAPPPAAGKATPSASTKHAAAQGGTVFTPYVDPLSFDMAGAARTAGIKHFNLAFILAGSGCTAAWDGTTALSDPTAAAHISAFKAAGGSVRVSFGGESGTELAAACDSAESLAAAYQSVLDAYSVTKLDFDVEGSELADTDANDRRAKAIAILERTAAAAGKSLSISFTLPVGPSGLTAASLSLLSDARSNGIEVDIVNIMAMDYGDDAAPNPDGQMGAYAISAMKGTQAQLKSIFGLSDSAAWRRVAVTPLIGVNEPSSEVFTVADALQVGVFARLKGAAYVSMWQIRRDQPCADGVTADASADSCAGGASSTFAYSRAFLG